MLHPPRSLLDRLCTSFLVKRSRYDDGLPPPRTGDYECPEDIPLLD